jgi:hypothetical protein
MPQSVWVLTIDYGDKDYHHISVHKTAAGAKREAEQIRHDSLNWVEWNSCHFIAKDFEGHTEVELYAVLD